MCWSVLSPITLGLNSRGGEQRLQVGWAHPIFPSREGCPLFRRTSSETPATEPVAKPGGKGRPTPTRKEAEAAARERARLGKDKKAMLRRQRALRSESSKKMRAAMKTGDEKYLPARDQGPVRRFIRDFVDSRLGFTELFFPMFILIFVLGLTGNPTLSQFSSALFMTSMLLVIVDIALLRYRVRRAITARFPGESLSGVTWYAVSRAMNMRFMRLPKPQVKIGQPLPEHYS